MDINLLGENGALPICRLVSSDSQEIPSRLVRGAQDGAQCDIPPRISGLVGIWSNHMSSPHHKVLENKNIKKFQNNVKWHEKILY